MTLSEKIGIVKGTGQLNSNRRFSEVFLYNHIPDRCAGRCIGDTTAVTRLGVPSFCFNDGPAGMRLTKNVTGFPAGINAASTFSRRLMRARGKAMAEEFRGKGAQSVVSIVSLSSSLKTILNDGKRVGFFLVLQWTS
jgi:beta-glucosidase